MSFKKKKNKLVDKRLKLVTSIIEGIELIKMYAWEREMINMVIRFDHE